MRYIGGKSLLLDNIQSVIDTYANDVDTITDIFSGSGAVGMHHRYVESGRRAVHAPGQQGGQEDGGVAVRGDNLRAWQETRDCHAGE